MSTNIEETVRKKLEQAAREKQDRNDKADNVIWAAVLINGGLGVVPFGINAWTFMIANAVMVGILGRIYGYHMSHKDAGKLIRYIFLSLGFTYSASLLGLKFFAEILKGAGVITMGGATPVGMALDAVLCGGISYAIGYTAKDYFVKGRKMSKSEMRDIFKQKLEEGKAKVKKSHQSPA